MEQFLGKKMIKKFYQISLVIILFAFSANALAGSTEESGSLSKHSLSLQVGINGAMQDTKSYGFQSIPPDVSYAYEFFDNNHFDISTATFYDNIGVKIADTDFSYRVGQRFDLAFEMQHCTPYVTLGLASIRYGHKYQTSPVYGFGYLKKISKHLAFVNEINFQHVTYQKSGYDILNASVGVVYNF